MLTLFPLWLRQHLKKQSNKKNNNNDNPNTVGYLYLPPVQSCLQAGKWWEAGCWSRWHLWPSTTVVEAGHMLLPQRLLAPFLPHWSHARMHRLTHTHTQTHIWNAATKCLHQTFVSLVTFVGVSLRSSDQDVNQRGLSSHAAGGESSGQLWCVSDGLSHMWVALKKICY